MACSDSALELSPQVDAPDRDAAPSLRSSRRVSTEPLEGLAPSSFLATSEVPRYLGVSGVAWSRASRLRRQHPERWDLQVLPASDGDYACRSGDVVLQVLHGLGRRLRVDLATWVLQVLHGLGRRLTRVDRGFAVRG